MHKRAQWAIAIVLAAAVSVWAADPWNTNPTDWTKKDVDKILRNSPWTKAISTPTTWARTGGEKFEVGPSSKVTLSSDGARVGSSGSSADPFDPQNHQGYFLLRWASAGVVRNAKMRRAQMTGSQLTKEEEAQPPSDLYELELVWDFFARFPKATEGEAAQNSYLKPSRLGVKFNPVRVDYRPPRGTTPATVVFYFAKTTVAGKPVIVPGENKVEFNWDVGPSSVRAWFNPQKMKAREDFDY